MSEFLSVLHLHVCFVVTVQEWDGDEHKNRKEGGQDVRHECVDSIVAYKAVVLHIFVYVL